MKRWFKFTATYFHRGTGPSTQVDYFYLEDASDEVMDEDCLEWAKNTDEGRTYLAVVDHARIDYEFERLTQLPHDVKVKKHGEYQRSIEYYQELQNVLDEVCDE
jgi:hypothetical protein